MILDFLFLRNEIFPFFQRALLLFEGAAVHLVVGADAHDLDGPDGPVVAVGLDTGDAVDDVLASDDLAEDGVLPVQVLAVLGIHDHVEL